jgi:hypothetical protein
LDEHSLLVGEHASERMQTCQEAASVGKLYGVRRDSFVTFFRGAKCSSDH